MGMGYLADQNELVLSACEITSNVAFAATAPLESLRTTPLIDPAVSAVVGTEDEPVVIEVEYEHPIDLTYAGLFDTNLRQEAYYRFEAFADAGRTERLFTTTDASGLERNVVPPLTDPELMRAGAPNQMRGDLPPRDFMLLPTNLHVTVPLCPALVLRWTLWGRAYRPDDSDDSGYSVGLAWAGDGLPISRHVGGSGDGVKDGDEVITTPGGGVWVEPGIPRRVALIDRTATDLHLRDEIFKLVLRGGKRKPLVWLPDMDSPADCFLYGGLYRRAGDYQHKFISRRYVSNSLDLEEWKE